MAKVRIESPFLNKITKRSKVHTKKVSADIHSAVKKQILALVSVGKSPVNGFGRFKPYAAQRSSASGNYPEDGATRGRFPGKKTRPVNLYLDGTYLEAITGFDHNTKGFMEFGLGDDDGFMKTLFEVHNEGERSDIPQRKVIPTGRDKFVPLITKKIKDIYLQRIKDIIRFGK